MLNAKTLTDTLSRMELPELQQYAELHKNDPYVVAMALSIANQKKQMNAAKQGQAGMVQQPKVVDQALAQMVPAHQMAQAMPEDLGIGQLPAPNMQRMAEGGIVAFDEGGEVPGYADGGIPMVGQLGYEQLVRLYETDPALARQAALRAGTAGQRFLAAISPVVNAAASVPFIAGEVGTGLTAQAAQNVRNMTPAQREALSSNPMLSAMSNDAGIASAIMNAPGQTPPSMSYLDQMKNALSFIPKTLISAPADAANPKGYGLSYSDNTPAAKPAAAAAAVDAAAKAAANAPYDPATATRRSMFGKQQPPGGNPPFADRQQKINVGAGTVGTAGNLVTPPSQQGIASLGTDPAALVTEMDTLRGKAPTTTPFDAGIEALTQANVKAAEDQKAQFESDIEKLGPAFKDREERLGKRKEKLDAQEDRLPYMALMEAGLNIMAGTSPNAMTNIGAGSAVGLKSYTAGVDKLMDARDKLDDAYGKIEEYRRTENMLNNKERRSLIKDINSAKTEGMKMGIQALQDEWKLNRKDATEMFTTLERNRSTVYSEQQQNLRNQVTANATVESANIHTQGNIAAAGITAKGHLDAAKLTNETYKLPMLYKAVEDSVDKQLAADINYKTADEATRMAMRDAALKKRLLATPGMAQFVPQEAPGGGANFVYQNGKLVPRTP